MRFSFHLPLTVYCVVFVNPSRQYHVQQTNSTTANTKPNKSVENGRIRVGTCVDPCLHCIKHTHVHSHTKGHRIENAAAYNVQRTMYMTRERSRMLYIYMFWVAFLVGDVCKYCTHYSVRYKYFSW